MIFHRRRAAFGLLCLSLTWALLSGCGGGKTTLSVPNPSVPPGLPAPSAPASVNTYQGAQGPGAWNLSLDNSKGAFSYQPTTYPLSPNTAVTGNIQVMNGFTKLGPAGYALELMGRAALMRPGGPGASAVFSVPQTACYAISGRVRFQYIAMQYAPSLPIAGQGVTLWYGSIAASADSTGKSWQFGDMQGNAGAGASSFTGTCSTSNGQSSISISGQPTLLNAQWPGGVGMTAPSASTQSTIWIGPSGFFVADQSDPTASPASGGSVAGVIEPSSPLNTSDVESHNYLGMLYQAATAGGGPGGGTGVTAAAPTQTSLVAFGPPEVGSGPGLQGGSYPNDDLTMAPGTDIVVNLGKEDSIYNGLYSSVSITVLDPAQNCANYTGPGETATSGINAQGYVTCTFPGIAVAGIPEGKYTIFVSAYNWAAVLGGAPMQIYLIQQ